jgi:hypothetical protein
MSVYRIIYFLLFLPVIIVASGKRFNWKLALYAAAVVIVSFFINYFMRRSPALRLRVPLPFPARGFSRSRADVLVSRPQKPARYFVLEMANTSEWAQRCCTAAWRPEPAGRDFKKGNRGCTHVPDAAGAAVAGGRLVLRTQDWADYRSLAPSCGLPSRGWF